VSTPEPPPADAEVPGPGPAGAGERLAPGALRRQVTEHLANHPEHGWTPTEIGVALGGRSSGAILNACEYLERLGHAEMTTAKPKTFRATKTTRAAIATMALVTTTPRPPRPPRPARPAPAAPPPRPTPAPPKIPPTRPDGGVVRPSGQVYRPRALAELPDVEALRKLRDAEIPVLLYGPPGTGKTSLIEAAFGDLITVAGDGDTQVSDFVGEYTQTPDGRYEFVYGPLVVAMLEGRVLFIDDATLISPAVLASVYPAMDGRKTITVRAHKGETITASPGFYIVGGHNPGVHGAVLTEALSSRFSVQVEVVSDYDLARSLKIDSRAVTVARNLARKRASGAIGWTPQLRELIAFQKIADVLGVDAAASNLVGIAPAEDRDAVADAVKSTFGRPVGPLTLGKQI